jgi:hypothetical protein
MGSWGPGLILRVAAHCRNGSSKASFWGCYQVVPLGGLTMTAKASQSAVQANDIEEHHLPLTLYLAGIAVVMNVLAALLSLMALSAS